MLPPRSCFDERMNPTAELAGYQGELFRHLPSFPFSRHKMHLRSILSEYLDYYHHERTHLSLAKDTPSGCAVEQQPENGEVVALPRLGRLHHRYEWRKAA